MRYFQLAESGVFRFWCWTKKGYYPSTRFIILYTLRNAFVSLEVFARPTLEGDRS
jgi:hypothetical protein